MTPRKQWVLLIDSITIKVIEFQNFAKPGADGMICWKFAVGIYFRPVDKWLLQLGELLRCPLG